MSQLLCKSVLKLCYTFGEYIVMHLILNEAHSYCAAAVRMYAERYPQSRLPSPHKFHIIDHHSREAGTVHRDMHKQLM
jgi:hypothetical protein